MARKHSVTRLLIFEVIMTVTSLKWSKEFQSKKARFPNQFLPGYSCENRRGFARNKAGGGRKGGWDGQVNSLPRSKDVFGSNARSKGTDIKSLSKLDKF